MLELVTRLSVFFEALSAFRQRPTSARRARLEEFLQQARPLLSQLGGIKPKQRAFALDVGRLGNVIKALRQPLLTARSRGSLLNVWRTAGLKRNEVRNAAVLASLWDAVLYPKTAIPFLRAFLARLPNDGSFPTNEELEAGYVVRTEDYPLGNADSRVDLSVEGATFLLVIEVKIDACEGPAQLIRYDELLRAKATLLGKRPSLILLGPRGPVTGKAVHASWTDVSAAGRAVGSLHKSREQTLPDQLLNQFAAHVAIFA